ncbi:TIGR03943 family putative permease subunit [Alkalicoccus luteus]|nr:TIGR03943 family protein [Alkalicoccus luteus]
MSYAFLRGVILMGFGLLILGLVLSGGIVYYIAPIMMPFIYFGMVTFFILGAVQLFQDKEDDHPQPWPVYVLFLVPLTAGFILPERGLDSSVAENRGVQYGAAAHGPGLQAEESESDTPRADSYLDDPDGYMEALGGTEEEEADEHAPLDYEDEEWFEGYYEELFETYAGADEIAVDEDTFIDVLTLLDLYTDSFEGTEVEVYGFAFREPDFDENRLVAARFGMTCCVADAGVYGLIIDSEEAADFGDDTWFQARGTIRAGTYNGQEVAILEDAELEPIEQPDSPYVYPGYQ